MGSPAISIARTTTATRTAAIRSSWSPCDPEGSEGGIEDNELPAVIGENREIVGLVVSMEAAPYMDPDKLPSCEQSLDSLCEEKTDEAQSMRYGMEGVGLPMLDAAEHLANY